MSTPTSLPLLPSSDLAIKIKGFITDPKLVGYQILTNYENMYWRPVVGNQAWSLYEVLRGFCHEHQATCFPSINLLTAILGIEQRRVLTGWTTKVKGKEYRYPGLIEILQQHKLVVAEVEGEGAKLHYIFHVNLTPGLLAEQQIDQLPTLLQKKHAELLTRCEERMQELESKRRPPKVVMPSSDPVDQGSERGSDNLSEGMTNCQGGSDNLSYKQHQYNNTQLTPNDVARAINNNSGDTSTKSDVVVASSAPKIADNGQTNNGSPTTSVSLDPIPLNPPSPNETDGKAEVTATLLNLGLAESVTRRLVSRYSVERIQEKIEFLSYLQEQAPERVKNPRGWLRRAIEENYSAPDGFLSPTERDRLAQELAQRAQMVAEQAQVAEELARTRQSEIEAQQRALRQMLQTQYGTTAEDYASWEAVKQEMSSLTPPEIFALIEEGHLLQCANGTITIGIVNEHHLRRLSHPNVQIAMKRVMSRIASGAWELAFVSVK